MTRQLTGGFKRVPKAMGNLFTRRASKISYAKPYSKITSPSSDPASSVFLAVLSSFSFEIQLSLAAEGSGVNVHDKSILREHGRKPLGLVQNDRSGLGSVTRVSRPEKGRTFAVRVSASGSREYATWPNVRFPGVTA